MANTAKDSAAEKDAVHESDGRKIVEHQITARIVSEDGASPQVDAENSGETFISEKHNISRRGLIAGCVGIAALIAAGGVGKAFAGDGGLIRPPGAQDEQNLLGACIRCDRCRSACPMNAISVGHLEDGFANTRSPVMDFNLGYCNFCEGLDGYRCQLSCPTEAILDNFNPGLDKMGLAKVDTKECLLYRQGSAMCQKQCISACPYGSLSQNENGDLIVDTTTCNGCGACHYVCPSASYGSYTGSGVRGINIVPVKEA